jgi:hypothetical protein
MRRGGAISETIKKGGTSGWEDMMAKARKKARKKTRKTAKRSVKKTRRAKKTTAKSKARRTTRKAAKSTVKPKAKKTRRAKARRAKAPQEGPIAGAFHVVTDTIREASALRSRLSGHDTFEDD